MRRCEKARELTLTWQIAINGCSIGRHSVQHTTDRRCIKKSHWCSDDTPEHAYMQQLGPSKTTHSYGYGLEECQHDGSNRERCVSDQIIVDIMVGACITTRSIRRPD
jgi:hypothetical protein